MERARRKGRTKDEVDRVICWLTGYDHAGLFQQLEQKTDFETFCMGDTLTHLPGESGLQRLAARVADSLAPGGRFLATFRDYTRPLEGVA